MASKARWHPGTSNKQRGLEIQMICKMIPSL